MDPYEAQLQHLLRMAETPGWLEHANWRAAMLERSPSGLWLGIRAEYERLREAMAAPSLAGRMESGPRP